MDKYYIVEVYRRWAVTGPPWAIAKRTESLEIARDVANRWVDTKTRIRLVTIETVEERGSLSGSASAGDPLTHDIDVT